VVGHRHLLAGPRAHLALATVVVFWAGAFSAIKHLLGSGLSAPQIAAGRYLLAAPGFAVALWMAGGLSGVSRRDLARIALAGLFVVTVYHLTLNEGERYTSSGTAAVIIGTAPGMTLALAIGMGLERFSWRRATGLGLAFAGVVVVVLLGSGQSISLAHARGPLIVLAAPFSFALYNVVAKPVLARHGPIAVSSAASLIGTAALLPFAAGDGDGAVRGLAAGDWVLLVYLGLFCTLFAYLLWTAALRELDPSRTVAYLYGVPVLAVVIGALTLGETITFWLAAGAALVISGVALAQARR
jgi:drug/metabolite transporter (DMT)-like permease